MIEVLLALSIIAIGMTSILGLFPVGLNASRNAIAQNLSADIADQMIAYMRVMGESSVDAYNKTFSSIPPYDLTCLPTLAQLAKTTDGDDIKISLDGSNVNVQPISDDFLTAYKTNDVSIGSSTFPRVASDWAIFSPKSTVVNLRRRIYFIVQGPNCTTDGDNRNIDYSAMALVWKSPVQIKRLESDGSTYSNWPSIAEANAYTYSGKINIEISWPLNLPYTERKKRYYQIVITKP